MINDKYKYIYVFMLHAKCTYLTHLFGLYVFVHFGKYIFFLLIFFCTCALCSTFFSFLAQISVFLSTTLSRINDAVAVSADLLNTLVNLVCGGGVLYPSSNHTCVLLVTKAPYYLLCCHTITKALAKEFHSKNLLKMSLCNVVLAAYVF